VRDGGDRRGTEEGALILRGETFQGAQGEHQCENLRLVLHDVGPTVDGDDHGSCCSVNAEAVPAEQGQILPISSRVVHFRDQRSVDTDHA
jgi:hypothetical protein